MKVSDYIAEFLAKQNVRYVFGITGGVVIHLFDSIGRRDDIDYVCTNHEQAAAMAADAYARVNDLGVCIATSGPGATNLITGVACSYFDSIPVLVITGQVPVSHLKYPNHPHLRQRGFQEVDVVDIFRSLVKYAVCVEEVENIRYYLEKAVHMAKSGRPGPVVLDIPDDVQRAEVDVDTLLSFEGEQEKIPVGSKFISHCTTLLKNAKKPLIILGYGIRSSHTESKVVEFIEKYHIPVVLTWAALDLLPFNHPLNVGTFGTVSSKYGNLAVQNADVILSLGSRLDMHKTGSNIKDFGRNAKKIVVDIDTDELMRIYNEFSDALVITADVNEFMDSINKTDISIDDISSWRKQLNKWKEHYPICKKEYSIQKEFVNPYVFLNELSKLVTDDEVIVTDAGATLCYTMQGFNIRSNQKLFSAFNNSPMGYSVCGAIGVSFARDKKQVIAIIGDGGLQMNIQELATIVKHKLPVKIFVFCNNGYGIIRQTQDDWLDSNYEGSCGEKGVCIPDFVGIAKAYGFDTEVIYNHNDLHKIKSVLDNKKPVLCEVKLSDSQRIIPKLLVGKSLEKIE